MPKILAVMMSFSVPEMSIHEDMSFSVPEMSIHEDIRF